VIVLLFYSPLQITVPFLYFCPVIENDKQLGQKITGGITTPDLNNKESNNSEHVIPQKAEVAGITEAKNPSHPSTEIQLTSTEEILPAGNKNFFKEGKGIPSPLKIRRFAGDGGWDQNCQAIIGLTKMNWNHDALYDRLPVTPGYAKVLATTIKRMTNIANK
jgi:hypothetical protein